MTSKKSNSSLAVEREKTKRYYGLLIVGGVIAIVIVVLFFTMFKPGAGGKGDIEITTDGIKVSLEQPLIQQVDTAAGLMQLQSQPIPVTKGRISQQVIKSVEKHATVPITPLRFVGRNLIDVKGGFVIAADSANWNVFHNDSGYMVSAEPIVLLSSKDSNSVVQVKRSRISQTTACRDVQCFTRQLVSGHRKHGIEVHDNNIQVDEASATSIVAFSNRQGTKQWFTKLVVANGFCYEATATYDSNGKSNTPVTAKQAFAAVAQFAVISN